MEFEFEKNRRPLWRRCSGILSFHQIIDFFKRFHVGCGFNIIGVSFGLLGRIQGKQHVGHVERMRVEQRERINRML